MRAIECFINILVVRITENKGAKKAYVQTWVMMFWLIMDNLFRSFLFYKSIFLLFAYILRSLLFSHTSHHQPLYIFVVSLCPQFLKCNDLCALTKTLVIYQLLIANYFLDFPIDDSRLQIIAFAFDFYFILSGWMGYIIFINDWGKVMKAGLGLILMRGELPCAILSTEIKPRHMYL